MKFACLLADGFEDIEALGTTALLRRAGIGVDFVSVFAKPTIRGSFGTEVTADVMMPKLKVADYDGLFVPGGRASFTLRETASVLEVVRAFHKANKYLMAICAGPTILAAAGVMSGRKYVCFPGTESDMRDAVYVPQMAVTDDTIITAIGAGAVYEFALAIIKVALGEAKAKDLAKRILYREFE